jgi:Zierdtviridae exonuclease
VPRGSSRTPLWFGTGVHLGLAEWYIPGTKRGIHPAETFAKFAKDSLHTIKVADATEEQVAEYEDGAVLGELLLNEYVKHWGQDESWDFIQAEKTFSLDIPWPQEEGRQSIYNVSPGELLLRYVGTFDGVYRDLEDGKIKLLETKTAAQVSTSHLSLDDQAGSYWAVAGITMREEGILGPKERIHGITYNFIRKGKPDERPRDTEGYACNKPVKLDYGAALGYSAGAKLPAIAVLEAEAAQKGIIVLGERSKNQPTPLFQREVIWRTNAERRSQLRRIQDEGVVMQSYRDKLLPITKNPNRDCSWDCSFFSMCELHERGGEWEHFKKTTFKQEDPYADHRKSAEG